MTCEELLSRARKEAASVHVTCTPMGLDMAVSAALSVVLNDLHAMLHPEDHPPGDPYFDPDHEYWDGVGLSDLDAMLKKQGEVFEWSAETIEWVDSWLNGLRKAVR